MTFCWIVRYCGKSQKIVKCSCAYGGKIHVQNLFLTFTQGFIEQRPRDVIVVLPPSLQLGLTLSNENQILLYSTYSESPFLELFLGDNGKRHY